MGRRRRGGGDDEEEEELVALPSEDEGGDEEEELADDDLEDSDDGEDKGKKKKPKRRRGSEFFDEDAEEDEGEEDDEQEAEAQRKKKQRSMFIDDIADVDEDDEEEEVDEDAEDLIDDKDMVIEDAGNVANMGQYRRMNREEEDRSVEEIARRIEERYKEYEGQELPDDMDDTGIVGQQGLLPTPHDPKLWMVTCRPGAEREAAVQLMQKYQNMYRAGTPMRIMSVVVLDHLKGYIYVEAAKESHVKDAIQGLRTIFAGKGVRLVPINEMVDAVTVNKKAKDHLAVNTWVRMRSGLYKDDLAQVVAVDQSTNRAQVKLLPRVDFQAMAEPKDEEERRRFPFGRAPKVRPMSRPFNLEEPRSLGLNAQRGEQIDGIQTVRIGSHVFMKGYMLRWVSIKSLVVLDAVPPLDEVSRFKSADTNEDDDDDVQQGGAAELSALLAAMPQGASAKPKFVKGDKVVITKGDLQNLNGTVDEVLASGKVMVLPSLAGFNEAVDFDPEELTKFFTVGQRVRILAGAHSGESGMVVAIKDELCTVISDSTKEEVSVFKRDLTETEEVSAGLERLGEYELHDLVLLDANTAGVIVKIEGDVARVLTCHGTPERPEVRAVRPTDIQRKIPPNRRAMTSDATNATIKEGDMVEPFTAGAQGAGLRGKWGTVQYVWRSFVFLKSMQVVDHGGFMCLKSRQVKVRGGQEMGSVQDLARSILGHTPRSTPGASPYVGASPSTGYVPQSPRPHDQQQPGGQQGGMIQGGKFVPLRPNAPRAAPMGFGGRGAGPGGFSGRAVGASAQSGYVGKMVRVVKGQYTGYRGRVKNQTATHCQLELDAMTKKVTIPIECVQLEGVGAGGPPRAGGMGGMGGPPRNAYGNDGRPMPHMTPSHMGSQTPAHYSMTPAHPSMTPAHAPYTPAHAPYTPMHGASGESDYEHEGGRGHHPMHAPTPGGYGGAYTPGLTPSGYTPQEALAPTPQEHGGVAGTPHLAPTPGVAGTPYMPAGTPGAGMDGPAPTPGGNFDGHHHQQGYTPAATGTPGLGGPAPTPGMPGQAYTPAFTPSAAYTPGSPGMGLDAATPGLAGPVVEDFSVWTNILVSQSSNPSQLGLVLSSSSEGVCSVQWGSLGEGGAWRPSGPPVSLDARTLTPCRPLKRDRVRIIKAETAEVLGLIGMLIGIDNNDGIVKCENGGDMKILDMSFLAKCLN